MAQKIEDGVIQYERFDTELGIQYSQFASKKLKKDYWVVKKGFIYYLDESYSSYVYVPKGYLTDGASVPRVFWNIIPPWGAYGQSCVLHDYLCEYPHYFEGLSSTTLSRKQVNSIFNDAMEITGLKTSKRRLIYGGVELYRHTINNGFEPKNVPKVLVEHEMREHYKATRIWK